MGAENARRVAKVVMERPYAICIASGFAGALKPEHAIGSILVAEAVQQIGKAKTVQSSRNLVLEAQRDGAFRAKMFLSSDSVVRAASEKAKLAPFAEAVDMESFPILSCAREHTLAAVAIRVISDTTKRDMPIFLDAVVAAWVTVTIAALLLTLSTPPLRF